MGAAVGAPRRDRSARLPRLGRRALRRGRRRRRRTSTPTAAPCAAHAHPRWHVSERTVSVLDGSTFIVGDRLGDLHGRRAGSTTGSSRTTRASSRAGCCAPGSGRWACSDSTRARTTRPVHLDAGGRAERRGALLRDAPASHRPGLDRARSPSRTTATSAPSSRSRSRSPPTSPTSSRSRTACVRDRTLTWTTSDRELTLGYAQDAVERSVTIVSSSRGHREPRRLRLRARSRPRGGVVDHAHDHPARSAARRARSHRVPRAAGWTRRRSARPPSSTPGSLAPPACRPTTPPSLAPTARASATWLRCACSPTSWAPGRSRRPVSRGSWRSSGATASSPACRRSPISRGWPPRRSRSSPHGRPGCATTSTSRSPARSCTSCASAS